jgi:hypothetical protein
MPLALDIYVSSLELKASKHRVGGSRNPNEMAVAGEAELALPRFIPPTVLTGTKSRIFS